MQKIVANAVELQTAISTVSQSVISAQSMFASVEAKMQCALEAARTEAEKTRIAKELAAFRIKAKTGLAQIRDNAQRTNAAFSRRLSLVSEKRG